MVCHTGLLLRHFATPAAHFRNLFLFFFCFFSAIKVLNDLFVLTEWLCVCCVRVLCVLAILWCLLLCYPLHAMLPLSPADVAAHSPSLSLFLSPHCHPITTQTAPSPPQTPQNTHSHAHSPHHPSASLTERPGLKGLGGEGAGGGQGRMSLPHS